MTELEKRYQTFRREEDRKSRRGRFITTGAVGVPISLVATYYLHRWDPDIPVEILGAIGAIIGGFAACIHDVVRRIGYWIVRKLNMPEPPTNF